VAKTLPSVAAEGKSKSHVEPKSTTTPEIHFQSRNWRNAGCFDGARLAIQGVSFIVEQSNESQSKSATASRGIGRVHRR
jgi:hypothetical protein